MNREDGILLESGTGELEILHFTVQGEHYAINVVKVKEILNIDNISKVPNAHPAVPGISLIRGDVITVIDMHMVLENQKNEAVEKSMTLVCEFNNMKVAFAIDEVLGISRITWEQILKPSEITSSSLVIGNINLNNKILMMLDFEKIVMDISPQTGITQERMATVPSKDRSKISLVLADDSPMIRQVLKDTLTIAGFENMKFYNDGDQALKYLMGLAEAFGNDFTDEVNVLITDIEMPKLDGHTLTRKIKEDKVLKKLPVIIFSSLITGDLRHKGESVGADAQLSKPEVGQLVELIDAMVRL
ncbi:MAG: chemotaxis protein CheV [Clostridia bacterium]|nr:chemotaxis protein CheV [Clostridia bacterium]